MSDLISRQVDVPDTNVGDTISRQAAIDAIESHIRVGDELYPLTHDDRVHNWGFEVSASCVYNLPSVDVKPVRHGRWETVEGWDGDELYRCSECGDEFVLIEGTPNDNNYWFCPHCGADMRGEQNA